MGDNQGSNDPPSPPQPVRDAEAAQLQSAEPGDADPSRDPVAGDAVKDDMQEAFNAGG